MPLNKHRGRRSLRVQLPDRLLAKRSTDERGVNLDHVRRADALEKKGWRTWPELLRELGVENWHCGFVVDVKGILECRVGVVTFHRVKPADRARVIARLRELNAASRAAQLLMGF